MPTNIDANRNAQLGPYAAAYANAHDIDTLQKKAQRDFVPLSIGELIAQCQDTMEGLDTQLRSRMNDQKARNLSLAGLGELSSALAKFPTTAPAADDAEGVKAYAESVTAAQQAMEKAMADHPELKELGQALLDKCGGGPSEATRASCATMIDGEADKLRSDNETAMIEIQSIVSKRGQMLQMTSNIVSSINESAKSVIQKIG